MEKIKKIIDEIDKFLIGKRDVVEASLVCLLSSGHLFFEDVPGVGKTTLAFLFAKACGGELKRIQFTPDLLPSDVTGVSVFNLKENVFKVQKGPVFSNFLLADEINRGTPKTQSALLEAMQERQVSIDGVSYPLLDHFMVIATMNPIEYEGTFPLPEAQLDRFTMKLTIGYPSRDFEEDILSNYFTREEEKLKGENFPIISLEELKKEKEKVINVFIHKELVSYIVNLVEATREDDSVYLGLSPRASIDLMKVSKATAYVKGRNFVLPDDIKDRFKDVSSHRIILKPEAKLREVKVAEVLGRILKETPIPKISSFEKESVKGVN